MKRIRLAAAVLGIAAAPAHPAEIVWEHYLLETFDGRSIPAELGRLEVVENREAGRGTLTLAFVRLASTAEAPGPPVVYLAGGPGGSGIVTGRGRRIDLFLAARAWGDVILLDQRGVGLSEPALDCEGEVVVRRDAPASAETWLAAWEPVQSACAAKWQAEGVDVGAYTTELNADDVEDLRIALGADRVTLWGTSYGTHLALSVLRRHPASVDRAILHGVEGPDHTLKLPSRIDANLRQLGLHVAADPAWGPRFPDLEAAVRAVVADYEASPLSVNAAAPFVLGGWEIQRTLAGIAGDSEALSALPLALDLLRSRNVEQIAADLAEARRRDALPAMTLSMDCASGASPERRARIAAEIPASALGGAADFPLPDICASWPVPELGDAFRAPVESDVPTLFISGTLDGRTPVANAREVMEGFSRARELVIEGASHDQLFVSDPGIWTAIEDLLADRPHRVERLAIPVVFVPPPDPAG